MEYLGDLLVITEAPLNSVIGRSVAVVGGDKSVIERLVMKDNRQ